MKKHEDKSIQCSICGLPIEEGEVNNCTPMFNCLNTTIAQENAMKN